MGATHFAEVSSRAALPFDALCIEAQPDRVFSRQGGRALCSSVQPRALPERIMHLKINVTSRSSVCGSQQLIRTNRWATWLPSAIGEHSRPLWKPKPPGNV